MSLWANNLGELRRKEMDIVRRTLRFRKFSNCLELGAGSGVQSRMLREFCDNVVASDLNEHRLMQSPKVDGIDRMVVDAEALAEQLEGKSYDFIFSSNMLEHLPRPADCLKGCLAVLADDGVIVHVVPNPTWRTLCTLLHPVAKARNLVYRLFNKSRVATQRGTNTTGQHSRPGNNLKLNRGDSYADRAKFKSFLPSVHGVSNGLIEETLRFRLVVWRTLFEKNGLEIITIAKGPISTGHGFGFACLKRVLEQIGISSEYIFVLQRKNAA